MRKILGQHVLINVSLSPSPSSYGSLTADNHNNTMEVSPAAAGSMKTF